MDTTIVNIVLLLIGGLLVMGIVFLIQGLVNNDRKKLQERLSSEGHTESAEVVRRSIVVQMEASGLPPALAKMPIFQSLQRALMQAYPDMALIKFLGISAGLGLMSMLIGFAFLSNPVFPIVAGLVAGYMPFFVLSSKRNKRQQTINMQMPEALDFLSRVLRAGHSLTTGLQMMGEELPVPIGPEFRRAYDQHSLGQPLEDCLKDMSTRINSSDFAFFITAVVIQRQTGGDLSEVLKNISHMIRQRMRLQGHVRAKTAEGRFTGYILVAFPACMFLLSYSLNPEYGGVLIHTSTGIKMLGVAFGLQMMGLWAIRKITTVKV